MRVGIVGDIEPVAGPAFAVTRRGQQLVDQLRVGVRRIIPDKGLDAFKAEAPPSPLLEQAALFERAFAADDLKAALEAEGSDYARHLLAALATKSPTSLAIALRQMQIGAALSFEEAMRVEFRIVSRICQGADFVEGVRAAIVDRDNRPQWAVAPESIESYFAPLGGDELKLGEAA